MGDRAVYDLSPELPIDLEKVTIKRSIFKTGKETREFKGIGIVVDVACAIIGNELNRNFIFPY